MSRIGKKPIPIPKGVTVNVADGAVEIQGPEGQAAAGRARPASRSRCSDGQLLAKTIRDDKELGKFHGLGRSLVANAVAGVTEGFKRELDIVGIGYRAELKGRRWSSPSATRTRSCSTSRRGSTSRSRSRRTSP